MGLCSVCRVCQKRVFHDTHCKSLFLNGIYKVRVMRVVCVSFLPVLLYTLVIFKNVFLLNLNTKNLTRSDTHREYVGCRPIFLTRILTRILTRTPFVTRTCSFIDQLLDIQPVSTRHSGSLVSNIWQWPLTTDNQRRTTNNGD